MTTGKDIAKFVSMVTGDKRYEEMYDQATEEQNTLKNETVNKFNDMVERIGIADKKKLKDIID